MPDKNLKKIIEALLFVSEKPLTLKQITEVCTGEDLTEIKNAVKELKAEYSDIERGIQITDVAGGYQFSTNPDCGDYLKKLYKTRTVWRLSAPALETLAIIAYKQPITRAEIEFIRGVNVDGVVRTLEERDLIKIKGRKEVPGRPILYGTTDEFLHYFGLKSLQNLPSIEEYEAIALEKANQAEAELNPENREVPEQRNDPEEKIPEESTDQELSAMAVDSEEISAAEAEFNPEEENTSDNVENVVLREGELNDEEDDHSEITKSN
ncbi:MAG: SMC-Scp complex subunit ScpB [Candidatus Omnitrophota bacterium]